MAYGKNVPSCDPLTSELDLPTVKMQYNYCNVIQVTILVCIAVERSNSFIAPVVGHQELLCFNIFTGMFPLGRTRW